jgi:hypothetical protein
MAERWGISYETIQRYASKNPHTIAWAASTGETLASVLEGSDILWPQALLEVVEQEVKWEV